MSAHAARPPIRRWTSSGTRPSCRPRCEIDEKILGEIADLTGGRYFRATDNAKLQSIYDEINQLEKSKVEISQYTTYTEEYLRWAAAALALLLVEFLLRTLWLKSLP